MNPQRGECTLLHRPKRLSIPMPKIQEHPILGRLIPDQWDDDLMFFRKFPELKCFWHPNSRKQLEDLEPQHRALVKKWDKQPGELAQICRNLDVLNALQSLGVYEVGVCVGEADQSQVPAVAQVRTWEEFVAHEAEISERICAAMLRYYVMLREQDPTMFEDEEDCPASPETIEDLTRCVRFDGMNLSPESIPNLSTISFGWDVDWDLEHGLQMILHDGQVIAMGNDLYSPEDLLTEANFYRELLNEEEQAAYESFSRLVASE